MKWTRQNTPLFLMLVQWFPFILIDGNNLDLANILQLFILVLNNLISIFLWYKQTHRNNFRGKSVGANRITGNVNRELIPSPR